MLLLGIPLAVLLASGSVNLPSPTEKKAEFKQATPENLAKLSPEQLLLGRTKEVDYKSTLENDATKTFTSAQNQAVNQYINLAGNEPNINRRYSYYVKAFEEMKKAYLQDKQLSYKIVMLQLKDYSDAFPIYKETDFVLP